MEKQKIFKTKTILVYISRLNTRIPPAVLAPDPRDSTVLLSLRPFDQPPKGVCLDHLNGMLVGFVSPAVRCQLPVGVNFRLQYLSKRGLKGSSF